MTIEVQVDGTAYVDSVAEALEICDAPNVTNVVIRDNAERLKLNRILRGFNLGPRA